ncbi:RDD family protein [Mycolicibacterium poriferae]|uniref:RDD family protein n=1 Tax=Mycolicibacterium poriferae TaxID=39694 RepID=UPI0024B9DDF3|nr:RDD family protein [Mycolicibacterium poriferae]
MAGSADVAHRTAGVVSRGVAAVIDLVVVGMLLGSVYLGLVLARLALTPGAFRFPALDVVFSTAVCFGVAVLYLAGCWSVSGCTAGAVVMGVQVVGRRAARLKPVVALGRAVACVVLPIGLGWVAVDAERRSLQDIVFGSRVIYVRS